VIKQIVVIRKANHFCELHTPVDRNDEPLSRIQATCDSTEKRRGFFERFRQVRDIFQCSRWSSLWTFDLIFAVLVMKCLTITLRCLYVAQLKLLSSFVL